MKILITGGAGFIGSAVVRHIIKNTQDTVVNIDKLTYAGNLESLSDISESNRYNFEHSDICDSAEITRIFEQYQPDAVMHLVAGGTTTWHDYAALVFDEARKAGITLALTELNAVPTSAYPTPASRPGNSRLNTEKFQRNFGLILPQWELGVKRMLTEMFTTTTI